MAPVGSVNYGIGSLSFLETEGETDLGTPGLTHRFPRETWVDSEEDSDNYTLPSEKQQQQQQRQQTLKLAMDAEAILIREMKPWGFRSRPGKAEEWTHGRYVGQIQVHTTLSSL